VGKRDELYLHPMPLDIWKHYIEWSSGLPEVRQSVRENRLILDGTNLYGQLEALICAPGTAERRRNRGAAGVVQC